MPTPIAWCRVSTYLFSSDRFQIYGLSFRGTLPSTDTNLCNHHQEPTRCHHPKSHCIAFGWISDLGTVQHELQV